MSEIKITDLLPIPKGTRQPHPYQVLGLEDGEQDMAKINGALESIVTRLKAAKEKTDPNVWRQAARLVKGAQEVLADQQKKAQLDARFGIVSVDSEADSSQGSSDDSLAAFLPTSNPLATNVESSDPLGAILPSANPLAPAESNPIEAAFGSQPTSKAADPIGEAIAPVTPVSQSDAVASLSDAAVSQSSDNNAMPPGLFGTPNVDRGGVANGPAISPSPVVVSKPQRHRKRSMAGTLLFVLFAFATFGAIGALGYFILFGSGPIAVTSNDGKITISTTPQDVKPEKEVAKPRVVEDVRPKKPSDPVMKDMGAGNPSDGVKGRPSGVASPGPRGDGSAAGGASMAPIEMTLESMTPSEASIDQASIVDEGAASSGMSTDPKPEMQPDDSPLTDAMIASADQDLAKIRTLIREANWVEMKPAAEAMLEKRLSETQQVEAQSLYELADLATYYRVGIEKAIADLNVGNDFEVSNDFRVVIVETGPDLLVIRFNARNKSYTFDTLPLPLAQRLATFQMPDTPTVEAAKAVYQAIVPNTTKDFRDQAIGWLGEIQGEVEGADPQQLAKTIRSLFEES